ncbi:winged helix-turn-helix domain-containing protein [Rhizobium sp. SYY.PMSO]|uniref:winged helix-turn-helix domain-containing protein n=1 Tax=Rhizobium sp. SYY.PMSO TaxID=3382192 RepID=UPI00399033D0
MTARKDCLFLTDAEIAPRVGMSAADFEDSIPTLERSSFPLKDPLFNNRRYGPAIVAFLDRRAGLNSSFVRKPFPTLQKKGHEVW